MGVRNLPVEPYGLAQKKHPSRQPLSWKVVAAGVAAALTLLYLVFTATKASAEYYLTVGQLRAKGPAAYGQIVRIGGRAADGSIHWNAKTQTLRFEMTDKNGSRLPVVYTGVVPDMFGYARDGHYQDAIVEGALQPDGVFKASQIIVKHDARFAAADAQATAQAGKGSGGNP